MAMDFEARDSASAAAAAAKTAQNAADDAAANFNLGVPGLIESASSVMLLCDSFGTGTGANSYTEGFAYQVARSLVNARAQPFPGDSGPGYHIDLNANSSVYDGLTSAGAFVTAGISGSRWSLADGQGFFITQRAYNSLGLVYDAAASTGSIQIQKSTNGGSFTALSTQAVAGGTGLKQFAGLNVNCVETDNILVKSVGGTIVLAAPITLKNHSPLNYVYVSARGGTAYQDYTTTAALDEIAFWLNLNQGTQRSVLVIALGTNSVYNPSTALPPAAAIAQLDALVQGVRSRVTNVDFLIQVPPKANEAIWPVIVAGYTYEDYARAIVAYAKAGNHGLIRNDRSVLSRTTALWQDGLHPLKQGHRIHAKAFCDALGIPLRTAKRTALPAWADIQTGPTMNSTWRAFTNTAALGPRVHLNGNIVTLSGLCEPNGSTATTIATLPVGMRPVGRDAYLVCQTNLGPSNLIVDTGGNIKLSSVTGITFVSLDGVTFAVNRV